MRTITLACLALLGSAPAARADLYTFTGSVQNYTVQTTGVYRISVSGAQGGLGQAGLAGRGASLSGDVTLTAGTVLEILVGGQGESNQEGGGGGGSFVYIAGAAQPLIAAGGGGGGGIYANIYGVSGGQTTTSGADATAPTAGAGGTGGQGGGGGTFSQGQNGGGGGGWLSGGGAGGGFPASGGGGAGAPSFAGGAGGSVIAGAGGYGGGGGAGSSGGGGGGGYSGGGGAGAYGGSGGGGGSYLDPAFTNVTMTAADRTGNGVVAINSVVAVPEPVGITLMGVGLAPVVTLTARSRRRRGTV